MSRHLVFVYGTLKSGEPNHGLLQPPHNARFIGRGTTTERFPLVIASRYNIPFVLDSPGQGNKIQGEIYEVDDTCLAVLDELEEHPDYYQRRLTAIEPLPLAGQQNGLSPLSDSVLQCSMYFLHDYNEKLLGLPMHENYSSAGPHRLPYCFLEDRVPTPTDGDGYSSKQDVKRKNV